MFCVKNKGQKQSNWFILFIFDQMKQSEIDKFFDQYFHPVATWVLLAMQILCGICIGISIWNFDKSKIFAFWILAVLVYITREMFDAYRWKRYVDADTGNRRVRRLKKKIWKQVKKKYHK